MKNIMLMAMLVLSIALIPGSMAACNGVVSVQPGDPVSLTISPSGQFDYLWTTPNLPEQSSKTAATFTFEAPVVTTPLDLASATAWLAAHPNVQGLVPADLVGCQMFELTGSVTAHPTGDNAYASCNDQCNIYLKVCPRPCPSLETQKLCMKDWTTYMANSANDEATADWQLSVGGTWQPNDLFTWTIKDENGATVGSAKTASGTPLYTFVYGDFTPLPIVTDVQNCFDVGVVVTSGTQTLLTCPNVGKVCLVYDPAGTISIT